MDIGCSLSPDAAAGIPGAPLTIRQKFVDATLGSSASPLRTLCPQAGSGLKTPNDACLIRNNITPGGTIVKHSGETSKGENAVSGA